MHTRRRPPRPEMIPVPRHDPIGSGEVVSTPRRLLKRLLMLAWDKIVLAIVLVAAVIGLPGLASHATRPAEDLEPDNHSGGGIITRYELLRLWLPEVLNDLAQRQSQSPVVRVHRDLKRFLELRTQEDLWYALTTRGHQVDGRFVDLTFIRRPYHEPQVFPEFLAVLATAAGNPPRGPDSYLSTVSITIIPVELGKREAREVISDLLGNSPSPAAQGRTR
jgi:hypothetical protein